MQKKVFAAAGKKSGALFAGLVLALAPAGAPLLTRVVSASATVHTIATCEQLQAMDDDSDTINDIFKLAADIDCDNEPFTPLTWDGDSFGGIFDGQDHTITGLKVQAEYDAGLFEGLAGATVKNLTISGTTYSNGGYAGGLAAWMEDGAISNVTAHMDVTSDGDEAGGLIAHVATYAANVHIIRTAATGDVSGHRYVGGLIGGASAYEHDLIIEQSDATGNVTSADNEAGGLIGHLEAKTYTGEATATVQDAYATGDVNVDTNNEAGGLIGSVDTYDSDGGSPKVVIQRVYSTGSVTGWDYLGGLIGTAGYNSRDGEVYLTNVFSASHVISTGDDLFFINYIGGIVGYNNHNANASGIYYDADRMDWGAIGCAGGGVDFDDCNMVNGEGSAPNCFFGNHTNPPLDAWNFNTVWIEHADTYPTLAAYDHDGISSDEEDAGPNDGDANNDGIPDSQQASVASFVNPTTGKYVVLEVPDTCSIASVSMAGASGNTVEDSAYTYPLGMMNFSITCDHPGLTATITQYYYGAPNKTYTLRKYSPFTHAYTTIAGVTFSAMTIGGQSAAKAAYSVTDGGSMDEDGTANGVIVDPSGLGVQSVGVPNTGVAEFSQSHDNA